MRDLESRISKIEKSNERNGEEILELLKQTDLNILEKTRILVDLEIISGEMIANWIMEGSKNE